MNRKLRNSLSAFTASGAVLAIALMVAVPAPMTPVANVAMQTSAAAATDAALAEAVVLSAGIATASALAFDANRNMEVPAESRVTRKGSHHRRQTVVMPYFSFSPRG